MTIAVDTNVLLDLVAAGINRDQSRSRLDAARASDVLVICEAVYAEMAGHFRDEASLQNFLDETGIQLGASSVPSLFVAGQAWRFYTSRRPVSLTCPSCGNNQTVSCSRCGSRLQPRQHVVADFLIGAHALVQADRLLTRDRGFYGAYFPELALG